MQQKRKILQSCWRGQPVSALEAVINSPSFSETVIWSPWFVPGCSTEHAGAAGRRQGLGIWGFAVASRSASVSPSVKLHGVLHERCFEIASIKSCSEDWGNTWLHPGNAWGLSRCPLGSITQISVLLMCLQKGGCAFPEKDGISINSPQGTWQRLHR